MKIVKFLDKTWQEIPDEDNPAMVHGDDREECLIIYKGKYQGYKSKTRGVIDGGIVVSLVALEGGVTGLGVFWKVDVAELFAELYAIVEQMKAADADSKVQELVSLSKEFLQI